jgi:hypothetical protein
MFKNCFVPNKLRNKAVEEICFDIHFVRQYYERPSAKLYDQSNTNVLKIDLQDSMRAYINADMTADICIWGPGMVRDVPIIEVIQEFIRSG